MISNKKTYPWEENKGHGKASDYLGKGKNPNGKLATGMYWVITHQFSCILGLYYSWHTKSVTSNINNTQELWNICSGACQTFPKCTVKPHTKEEWCNNSWKAHCLSSLSAFVMSSHKSLNKYLLNWVLRQLGVFSNFEKSWMTVLLNLNMWGTRWWVL